MQAWSKLAERAAYDGYRRVVSRTFRLPDGRIDDFEVKEEGATVAVLAVTPDREILLVREFRPGPERVLCELPGGAIDGGETPLAAARRELREETGHEGRLEHVGASVECAYSTRVRHTFVAHDCRRVGEPGGDETEFVEVVRMPLPEFRAHLRGGQLTDLPSGYLALDHLGLL